MKSIILIAAAVMIVVAPTLAFAQKSKGQSKAPGQMMHKYGPVAGSPGASGYAPGHLKKKKAVKRYVAPRRETRSRTSVDSRTRYNRTYR